MSTVQTVMSLANATAMVIEPLCITTGSKTNDALFPGSTTVQNATPVVALSAPNMLPATNHAMPISRSALSIETGLEKPPAG